MTLTIETPAGKMNAPAHIAADYAAMTDEALFEEVRKGAFVDPFALGEIQRRGKLAAYYNHVAARKLWEARDAR